MAVLRAVEVKWASVQKPNVMYDPQWEILAIFNSDEQANSFLAEAKEICPPKGKVPKLRVEEDGRKGFRFRRRVERADGEGENQAPLVCGPGGKDDIFTQQIGNGSVCNIQYTFNKYDNKFGKGVTVDLKGVQVLTHVPFGVQDGDEFGEEESKSSNKSSSSDDNTDSNEYDDEDF